MRNSAWQEGQVPKPLAIIGLIFNERVTTIMVITKSNGTKKKWAIGIKTEIVVAARSAMPKEIAFLIRSPFDGV